MRRSIDAPEHGKRLVDDGWSYSRLVSSEFGIKLGFIPERENPEEYPPVCPRRFARLSSDDGFDDLQTSPRTSSGIVPFEGWALDTSDIWKGNHILSISPITWLRVQGFSERVRFLFPGSGGEIQSAF